MKTYTVKDVIEKLSKMDQDAVVCTVEVYDNEPVYYTLELIREIKDVEYTEDDGSTKKGNIISIL